MSRSQILLVAGAAVVVVLMFLLPKVIINKEERNTFAPNAGSAGPEQVATVADHDPNHEGHEDHAHAAAAPATDTNTDTGAPHAVASPGQRREIRALLVQYNREQAEGERVKLASQLGAKYASIAKHDSAGYFYEEVAKIRPTEKNFQLAGDQYFEAFSFAANQQRAQQLSTKTREMYEGVLRNNPSNTDAKTNVAMTYIASESPMQGIQLLREVLATDPRNEKALFNMGILSIQSNQYDKAVERFQTLVEVNPRHVNGNFYLGVALAEAGRKQEAEKVFRRVKELDQDPALLASVDEYLGRLQDK
jgi:tetratricopeptide (TPR) repeat protein